MKKLGCVLITLLFVMSLAAGVSAKQPVNETEKFMSLPEYNEYYSDLSNEAEEFMSLPEYNAYYSDLSNEAEEFLSLPEYNEYYSNLSAK